MTGSGVVWIVNYYLTFTLASFLSLILYQIYKLTSRWIQCLDAIDRSSQSGQFDTEKKWWSWRTLRLISFLSGDWYQMALTRYAEKKGNFTIRVFNRAYVLLKDPRDIEKVLNSSSTLSKNNLYAFVHDWVGSAIGVIPADEWIPRRKMMNPLFHTSLMSTYIERFNRHAETAIHILQNDKDILQDGFLDVNPFMSRFTVDVAFESVLATDAKAQITKRSRYLDYSHELLALVVHRIMRPWFYPKFIWGMTFRGKEEKKTLHKMHEHIANIIQKRKTARQKNPGDMAIISEDSGDGKLNSVLDLLLDAQKLNPEKFSDESIRDELHMFMEAAHDTVAISLTFTLFLFGKHPQAQRRARDEIDFVTNQKASGTWTLKDLSQLNYLEACVKESLRLYPSVPLLGRQVSHDLRLADGNMIPKGVPVMYFIGGIQRDPKYFPNPTQFIPERFLQSEKTWHPYAYLPFLAGSRNCIGNRYAMYEIKVFFAHFLQHFNVESNLKDSIENVKVRGEIVLRSVDGIQVKVIPRDDTLL